MSPGNPTPWGLGDLVNFYSHRMPRWRRSPNHNPASLNTRTRAKVFYRINFSEFRLDSLYKNRLCAIFTIVVSNFECLTRTWQHIRARPTDQLLGVGDEHKQTHFGDIGGCLVSRCRQRCSGRPDSWRSRRYRRHGIWSCQHGANFPGNRPRYGVARVRVRWRQQCGILNATGASVCQGGNLGGNEKSPAGFPHNQTFTVSNASQIGLVFNADQPAGGSISVTNLTLALFNSSGTVGFTSGAFTPLTLNTTQPGIGNSGFLFVLDSTQAAAAQAAINGGFDLLGLSATTTPAAGGPETFFLTSVSGTSVPETGTLSSLGIGLVGLALLATVRRP